MRIKIVRYFSESQTVIFKNNKPRIKNDNFNETDKKSNKMTSHCF